MCVTTDVDHPLYIDSNAIQLASCCAHSTSAVNTTMLCVTAVITGYYGTGKFREFRNFHSQPGPRLTKY